MKITDYKIQKNNEEKMNVYVDGEYKFSMSVDSFLSEGLYKGLEITEEQIEEIKIRDGSKLAYIQIVSTLNYGMKTEKEMIDKLKEKGYEEDAIQKAITKAKDYNLINDDYYIELYIKTKAIPAKWGEQKIISNLYKKGININDIKLKISEVYDEEDKYDNAYSLAIKKLKTIKEADINKKKQKLNQFLLGKGYSYEIVSKIIKNILNDEESDY